MTYYCLTNKCGYLYSLIKDSKRTVIVFKHKNQAQSLHSIMHNVIPDEKITVDTKDTNILIKNCENIRMDLYCIDTNTYLYKSNNNIDINSLEFNYRLDY